MTRGQLPKAYLRVDPNLDQTHPDNLDGFLRLLAAANRQPKRGRFRARAVLDGLFGKRAVDRLYARGDVVDQPDGSVLVPGWDEWQEGDLTVGERMARLRSKPVAPPSQPRNSAVTEPSPDRSTPSEASRRLGVKALEKTPKTPTAVPARETVVRLTKDQLDAWSTFTEDCWGPFKEAWLGRHLAYPPTGHPDDDPGTSQRSRLYAIADARPNDLGRWVREAPGRTAHEVIAYVFAQLDEVRAEAGLVDDPEWEAEKAVERRAAPERIGRIMAKVVGQ